DELSDLVDGAGDAGEAPELQVGREARDVPVSASGTDSERRHLHARPGHIAPVDRVAQRHVDELSRADIANAGESGVERSPRIQVRGNGDVDGTLAEEILDRKSV